MALDQGKLDRCSSIRPIGLVITKLAMVWVNIICNAAIFVPFLNNLSLYRIDIEGKSLIP